MWRSRRSETHGNRRLWDEGGMRDIESSRKNVLVSGQRVSRRLNLEWVTHFFHEGINDVPMDDFLGLSP